MKDYQDFYNEIKQHNFKNPSDKSGLSSDERTVFDFRYNYVFFKNLPLNPEERINIFLKKFKEFYDNIHEETWGVYYNNDLFNPIKKVPLELLECSQIYDSKNEKFNSFSAISFRKLVDYYSQKLILLSNNLRDTEFYNKYDFFDKKYNCGIDAFKYFKDRNLILFVEKERTYF